MCDKHFRAIRLDGDGWEIVESIPDSVPLIRANSAQSYEEPDPNGDLGLLRQYLGGSQLSDVNWTLIVGFLLASMREEKFVNHMTTIFPFVNLSIK